MRAQGAIDFLDHWLAHSGRADEHDGIEMVRPGLQAQPLFFGQDCLGHSVGVGKVDGNEG